MKIKEVKEIIKNLGLAEGTMRLVGVLIEGEDEKELTVKEIRQLVALIEVEVESGRDEIGEIDDLVFKLKNIVSGIDNAAEMFDKDLKTLE